MFRPGQLSRKLGNWTSRSAYLSGRPDAVEEGRVAHPGHGNAEAQPAVDAFEIAVVRDIKRRAQVNQVRDQEISVEALGVRPERCVVYDASERLRGVRPILARSRSSA